MTVADQARVFLAMTLCGAGVGAAYDLLAVFRRGTVMTAAADLFLGVLCAVGVILTALVMQADPFRLYVAPALVCGAALYACSLGTIVRILTEGIGKLSKKVANRMKKGKIVQENDSTARM